MTTHDLTFWTLVIAVVGLISIFVSKVFSIVLKVIVLAAICLVSYLVWRGGT